MKMKKFHFQASNVPLLFLTIFLVITPWRTQAQEPYRIWDKASHNAFVDLIYFKGYFYCSFREGIGHIPNQAGEGNGVVRILRSADGVRWENLGVLAKEGIDLRDPKLSVTPNGRIMVIMGGSIYTKGRLDGRIPQVAFSNKSGKKFSEVRTVSLPDSIRSWGNWLWRVTWHGKKGYTLDYQIGPKERRGPTRLMLLQTKNGRKFTPVSTIDIDGYPNEATIRFDEEGGLYALIRRELGDFKGVWAVSKPPYTYWKLQKVPFRLGGPNFLFLDSSTVVMGTRSYVPDHRTAIYLGDKKGDFRELMKLPSGGDNSYPGMVIHAGKLWIAYYSSHEGKAMIYMKTIPLNELK